MKTPGSSYENHRTANAFLSRRSRQIPWTSSPPPHRRNNVYAKLQAYIKLKFFFDVIDDKMEEDESDSDYDVSMPEMYGGTTTGM